MDDNKRLDEASMTHTHKVTMPQALAIDAMQDVLDLANTTITDMAYVIAISMSLDALKEVPQLRAQLAAVTAERDAAASAIERMAEYIVSVGRVDYFLCDDIPRDLHLKYQPKDDGNYDNGPCIKCVKEYFKRGPQGAGEGGE